MQKDRLGTTRPSSESEPRFLKIRVLIWVVCRSATPVKEILVNGKASPPFNAREPMGDTPVPGPLGKMMIVEALHTSSFGIVISGVLEQTNLATNTDPNPNPAHLK